MVPPKRKGCYIASQNHKNGDRHIDHKGKDRDQPLGIAPHIMRDQHKYNRHTFQDIDGADPFPIFICLCCCLSHVLSAGFLPAALTLQIISAVRHPACLGIKAGNHILRGNETGLYMDSLGCEIIIPDMDKNRPVHGF